MNLGIVFFRYSQYFLLYFQNICDIMYVCAMYGLPLVHRQKIIGVRKSSSHNGRIGGNITWQEK